ncbi:hypothetical protein CCY17_04610 [Mediterraneibacter gnavus]|nr:hypothetical protein CCY17_04610 [Mediterraneibacter gnavus]
MKKWKKSKPEYRKSREAISRFRLFVFQSIKSQKNQFSDLHKYYMLQNLLSLPIKHVQLHLHL